MASQEQSDAPEIPEEDKKRLQKATTLLTAYTNFMRWAGNFRRDEIKRHPRHSSVMMLSTMQSSRFAFAVDGSTLLLAAQPFEMTWLSAMPFDSAYVSDRLYLSTDGAQCMEVNLPPLTIGIWCDQRAKREEMAQANYLVPVEMNVYEGEITDVGRPQSMGIKIKKGDVVAALNEAARDRQNSRDLARIF